jgi:hypothetical protein
MFTSLHTQLKRASRLLPVALLSSFAAQAQTFNYTPANAVNAAGTYTDLGTTGAAITTANTDNANSAAQDIGFTFNFNGVAFTQFVLNTNGFIKLGATAPSSASLFIQESNTPTISDPISSTNAANINIVAPFNMDLAAGTAAGGAEYRVTTSGTAPNRVCTIQWKNVSDKTVLYDLQYSSISFQAKLYETTNNVEFVYDNAVQGPNPNDYRFAVVGLKGTRAIPGQTVVVNKTGTGSTPWSAAVFLTGYYSNATGAFNYSGNVRPDAGRTYRFVSAAPCADPTNATIGSTNNSIQLSFTPGAGNVSYNVTYTAGGAPVTLSPAPTTSPITITGLVPGTIYTVTLQSVCSTSSLGTTLTGTVTTTGTPPAATYATLPYTESFEATWVNGLSTRDLPTTNWRNSPASGDNSWRRDDDGVSANWQYTGADADPTLNIYDTRFSVGAHSARFHTYGAGPVPMGGSIVGKLDLYVNLSGTGNKTLTFDYINPTGLDKLEVFLSTDGGATFSTTPLLTATTSATFTGQTVVVPSTSATSVLRFQATSDYGDDDLGIDNLRLSLVTATRNEALAATVALFPNPAHGSFQLLVPAGNLHAATATLSNALGQVVLSRKLNLPAAGGTADFDVSRLAAGVYSLTLKSGNDLVVKRVVVE